MDPKIMNLITRQSQDAAVFDGLLDSPHGDQPWLDAEEFVYVPFGLHSALLRLLCRRGPEDSAPTEVALLVRCDLVETCYRGWPGEVAPRRRLLGILSRPPLLWRATFEVPLSVAEHPDAVFALCADQRVAVALPAPRPGRSTGSPAVSSPTRVRQVRLHGVALVAGVAAAAGVSGGATTSTSTAALSPDTATSVMTTPAVTAPNAGAGTTDTTSTPADTTSTPADTTSTPADTISTPADTISTPADTTSTATGSTSGAPITAPSSTAPSSSGSSVPADPSPRPLPTQLPAPAALPTRSSSTPTSSPSRPAPPTIRQIGKPLAPPRLSGSLQIIHSGSHVHPGSRTVGRPSRPAARTPLEAAPNRSPHTSDPAARGGQPLLTPWTAPVALDLFTAGQIRRCESIGASLDQPPAYLVSIYRAAGRRYHVPWQILAAINAIETDYGQNLNVSVAGAIGWMQFEPSTWLAYGVRVDGAGPPNPYDPKDAIFSAARYLAANGAPQHMREAIYAYNHALWYVDSVLWRAQLIGDRSLRGLGRESDYALPLDAHFIQTLGRTDDGVDIETAPDGAAVYSIAPGVVSAVASDPGGFGPDYPVILVTAGPLAGQYIYYGHVAASLVHVGDHVLAGQPIAVMGHTGDAASLGHGHIEIGFSDGSGDPLNRHGAGGAWTPAGDAMRRVLDALRTRLIPKHR